MEDGKETEPQILVVDDEPMNIEVMEMMISNNNQSIDRAHNGLQAIAKVKDRLNKCLERRSSQNMYKLILLDYSMPEMDGPQVSMNVRDLFASANW